MKVKVYRATGKQKDYIDAWSIYFPYSSEVVLEEMKRTGRCIKGIFLSCSPYSSAAQPGHEFVNCGWCELDIGLGYSIQGLGKRVYDIPEVFQKFIDRMEPLWNEALKTGDFTKFDKQI